MNDVYPWMDGCMDVCMDGCMDGCMGAWADTEGRKEGLMCDGYVLIHC